MTRLIPFSFEGSEVRVLERDGEPWWVLADVCKVLEHSNSRMMADRLDADEKGVSTVYTLGGVQEMTIINESGLWSLVLTSRKPAAKRFKKWVTSKVIPTIRKTGFYHVDGTLSAKQTGGIAKAVINKALEPIMAQVEVLTERVAQVMASYDPNGAFVTDYRPMLSILEEYKIPAKGRRAFSSRCSGLCNRYLQSEGLGAMIRISRETGRRVFKEEGIKRWLAAGGASVILQHRDAALGQTTIPFPQQKRSDLH